MAGIGFELRKLYARKGIISKLRAYAFTGVIVTGPTLLGMGFLFAVQAIGISSGISSHERELLACMITYALLGSLVLTGFITMPLTRYVSDMLYEGREDLVLPSFEGALAVLLPVGVVLCLAFQLATGQGSMIVMLNVMLFGELIVVWISTTYLSAIKDYRGILTGYLISMSTAIAASLTTCLVWGAQLRLLLACVTLGYGIMMVYSISLLYRFFPHAEEHYLLWLAWVADHRDLVAIGVCNYVAVFSYIAISWFGPLGKEVAPLYYASPEHDIPAFFAFLSGLITQITFVASAEVNFYPVYRRYYDLFNTTGSIVDIDATQEEMLMVLDRELGDLARKQLLASALCISVGSAFLEQLPLGFTPAMSSYFVLLCVGYCAYSIGNVVTLMDLYFDDTHGVTIATVTFALVTTLGSLAAVLWLPVEDYAAGFVVGALVFLFVAWLRLYLFTRNLPYMILSEQPLVAVERRGLLKRLSERA